MERERQLTYQKTEQVRINPEYPRYQLVCGNIYVLRNAEACREEYPEDEDNNGNSSFTSGQC